MKFAEIYGLFDPDTNALRYIGKANNSAKRFLGHLGESRRKTPLYCWIGSLLKQGKRPTMRVLEICPYEDWGRAERQHIFEARLRGERLLNLADGGNAPKCSIETRSENGRTSVKKNPVINKLIIAMGKAAKEREPKSLEESLKFRDAQQILRRMNQAEKDSFTQKWIARHPWPTL